ncbi:hypothetical protein [Rhizobium sp. LjRoot258]|uniref:hypothetical protein n=1 Tax=Rhizobium sp. LjRoot258 TaxID=3342299 RepID=UPI003ECDDD5A
MCDLDENTTGRAVGKPSNRLATSLLPAALFVAVTAFPAALIAANCARAEQMEIIAKTSRETVLASSDYLAGEIQVSSPAPVAHQERYM